MYFLTPPWKRAIFEVGHPIQINYLIDEAVDKGKGANAVLSILHFFEVQGLSKDVHLHVDNCGAQNHSCPNLPIFSFGVFRDFPTVPCMDSSYQLSVLPQ